MENIKNVSPLRYPGGKTRACKILDSVVNEHFNLDDYTHIISPFFGGGSFEFFLQNKYHKHVIANDKFTPLYTFWQETKTNNKELCTKLRKVHKKGVSKEDFLKYRKKVMTLKNKLNKAKYYFIINRCSFSGATLSGGFSKEASTKRFTESSINKTEKLNLENIDFYNEDCIDFIKRTKKYNAIMFLDPPYYLKKSNLYGKNGDMHENFDHKKLQKSLKKRKNWILTYNDCEYIRDLYKDYKIIETTWSYGMNKTKKSSEIIIINNK